MTIHESAPYLALPAQTPAPGVVVLHAWWGLTPVFRQVCDRLAEAGFVALAPDLYAGTTADTVEAAADLIDKRDSAAMAARAEAGLRTLRAHPAVRGDRLGAVGFSMGASWALALAGDHGDIFGPVVLFYGTNPADFSTTSASFQGHFAEHDEWEPIEGVRQMEADMRAAGRAVELHLYPGVGHWFVEPNRPEYSPAAAELAWQRALVFLRDGLEQP